MPTRTMARRASGPTTYDRSRSAIWWVLAGWCAVWAAVHFQQYGYSWRYFALGADLLTHPSVPAGGLHLYAAHPELQIGPLALLVAAPLQALGPTLGRALATLTMTASGLLVLTCAAAIRGRTQRVPRTLFLSTGALLLPVWTELGTHYAHLDDVLALLLALCALIAWKYRQPELMACLLAASADSKPWALAFGVLLLAVPSTARRRPTLVFLGGVALAWLPFVLADPGTLSLGHFAIPNVADSALRALGVTAPSTPSWDRPAQLLLGAGVGALAIRRGRWTAVPLAVVASRLLLDPQTYAYYTSGLVVAAAVIDLTRRERLVPLWTASAFGLYAVDQLGTGWVTPHLLGLVRATYCVVALILLTLPPVRQDPPRNHGDHGDHEAGRTRPATQLQRPPEPVAAFGGKTG